MTQKDRRGIRKISLTGRIILYFIVAFCKQKFYDVAVYGSESIFQYQDHSDKA
jgi:hypothetical protein